MTYRQGNINDLPQLKKLALTSWSRFKADLTEENWLLLKNSLKDDKTYTELLLKATCFVCENNAAEIIGMGFLVPHGNPTEIYDSSWCYIRFLTVDPNYSGKGIGKCLTKKCIQLAIDNNEKTIALHTSELMHNAMHIYESNGFKIVRELEPRLGKRYWLYTLEIG